MKRISIIAGIVIKHDAISSSVRDDYIALSSEFEVRVFTYRNEFRDIRAIVVQNVSDIIFHRFFIESDLIMYHFGIYCDLFNAVCVGNGHAAQAVRYHNITSKEFLPESDWPTIERSQEQLYNLRFSQRIWPVSDYNRVDLLKDKIVDDAAIEMIPLIVSDGVRMARFADKARDQVRIVYLGRFVKSKGLDDLISAIDMVRQHVAAPIAVHLLGSERFSDKVYIRALKDRIQALGLGAIITFVGEIAEEDLREEFAQAHMLVIPSYHEGFCKPVIEAMHFGCVPVTYDSGNLAFVGRGCSRVAPAGDIDTLADYITSVARTILSDAAPGKAVLELDGRTLTIDAYEREVDDVIRYYSLDVVALQLRSAARALISPPQAA